MRKSFNMEAIREENRKMVKAMSDKELKAFIRGVLFNNGERLKFDMSGYGDNVVTHNNNILHKFEHIGIFDYHLFVNIDFYKGSPTISFGDFYNQSNNKVFDGLGGYGTTELIFIIIKNTLFSNKTTRRRY